MNHRKQIGINTDYTFKIVQKIALAKIFKSVIN